MRNPGAWRRWTYLHFFNGYFHVFYHTVTYAYLLLSSFWWGSQPVFFQEPCAKKNFRSAGEEDACPACHVPRIRQCLVLWPFCGLSRLLTAMAPGHKKDQWEHVNSHAAILTRKETGVVFKAGGLLQKLQCWRTIITDCTKKAWGQTNHAYLFT